MHARKSIVTLAAMALASTGLTACLGGDTGGEGGSDEGGGTVTVWLSVDQPVVDALQTAIDAKAEEAGIEVKLQKVENINQLIMTKIQANDTPEIALIPQPGVVRQIVERDAAIPLGDVLDVPALEETMTAGTLEAGMVDDELYALLVSMNVKSFVFYNKAAFEEAGYQAPDSIDGLVELTNQIKADGGTPWCMGIESDTATGWPATDWFEDLIMRYGGVDGYNDWVTHEIPFDSDLVRQAAGTFEELLFTEGNVLGGRKAISSTNFGTAGNAMFDDGGPSCWLYKQGSFIADFLEEGAGVTRDEIGLFPFPPAEPGGDNPVLGGGDLAVLLSDSEDAKTAMQLLAEPDIGNDAAPNTTFISPHTTFDASLYPDDLTRDAAATAYESSAFLFDGSDQMPGEVGAGSFWREMTAWISNQQDLDTTLTKIDESWPS